MKVGGRQLLLGGHSHIKRWRHILAQAKAARIAIKADALLLPHLGMRDSLSSQVLAEVVNPAGFVAILPTSPIWRRPKYKIPDDKVLAAVSKPRAPSSAAATIPSTSS